MNRTFPAGPDGIEPADIRGIRNGVYAFQTSGVPGFAGDYLIAMVEGGQIAYFKTLYTTEPDLLQDAAGGYSQHHQDQMVPSWSHITIPYAAYVAKERGGKRRGRRVEGMTSVMADDERRPEVETGIQFILQKYGPTRGALTWQEIMELSEADRRVAPGAPYSAGEVAEAIRRLVNNNRAFIRGWQKLPWAPPELPLEECTAKNCEPLFALGRESFLAGPTRRNPKGDGLDHLRAQYQRYRNDVVEVTRRKSKAAARSQDDYVKGFDQLVENVVTDRGYPRDAAGYMTAAHEVWQVLTLRSRIRGR